MTICTFCSAKSPQSSQCRFTYDLQLFYLRFHVVFHLYEIFRENYTMKHEEREGARPVLRSTMDVFDTALSMADLFPTTKLRCWALV